jgi:NarL family two-component system response regulator LiaR
MASDKIRLIVAEDDGVLRRSIVELLRLEDDLHVVSDVADGEDAVAQAAVLKPDVVLADIEMPRMTGIEATRRIRKLLPDTQVVVLTKFGDDENVFSAIKAGAAGYVLKDAGLDEIAGVIRAAAAGEGFLSPALVSRVMAEFNRVSKSALHNRKLFAELSRREVEVLECIAAGMRNSQIADKLSLAEKTVKSHVGAILKKLHVNDRTEAAIVAREGGIV